MLRDGYEPRDAYEMDLESIHDGADYDDDNDTDEIFVDTDLIRLHEDSNIAETMFDNFVASFSIRNNL